MTLQGSDAPQASNAYRRFAVLSLLAGFALIGWTLIMPGGFPIDHPRFWANRVIPPLAAAVALASAFLCWRSHPSACPMAFFLPALITGLLGTCLVLFTQSLLSRFFVVALVPWGYLLVSWIYLVRKTPRAKMGATWLIGLIAVTVGGAWARTQRAPIASTKSVFAEVATDAEPAEMIDVAGAWYFEAKSIKAELSLNPFLQFESFSPDRFWTLFTPGYEPEAAPSYAIERRSEHDFTTWTTLSEENHTHLNAFAEMTVSAAAPISISFSPCPTERIAVLPSDYPVGRPARAAFVTDDGRFRVVEGRSGEKGPFKTLAAGDHTLDQALALTLYAGDDAVFRITFEDFTRQCSTELSPTAGWGFSQNSIYFSTVGEDTRRAFISMSLANTGVGRGWDSVSHGAGVYRNKMRVEVLK